MPGALILKFTGVNEAGCHAAARERLAGGAR